MLEHSKQLIADPLEPTSRARSSFELTFACPTPAYQPPQKEHKNKTKTIKLDPTNDKQVSRLHNNWPNHVCNNNAGKYRPSGAVIHNNNTPHCLPGGAIVYRRCLEKERKKKTTKPEVPRRGRLQGAGGREAGHSGLVETLSQDIDRSWFHAYVSPCVNLDVEFSMVERASYLVPGIK